MPIISAAIVNKQGKVLLSRQFTDISRIRIEGLLVAFPKLLSSEGAAKQCTFIESGAVRYVYQPLEDLLLVLVTTRSSNIVEDLNTLRLLGRMVPEYVPVIDEGNVSSKAFEILFAFDEAITGGLRENVSMDQIVTFLAMESHEEELAKEEKKRQMELAHKEARRRAHELAKKKREGGFGGIGSGSGPHVGGVSTMPSMETESVRPTFNEVVEETSKPKPKAAGGMSLGRARKADMASKVLKESGVTPTTLSAAVAPVQNATPASAADQKSFHVKIEEKISVSLNRDGGVSSLDIRGDLFVQVADAQAASVRVGLARLNEQFNFKTHPNINKALFTSDRVLAIKDNKPYPTQQSLGIVRWRLQTVGAVKIPLSVTCWPADSGASVEFELENPALVLRNVVIAIPCAGTPQVDDCSTGDYVVDGNYLRWQIPEVSSRNANGTIELALDCEVDPESFFPTVVRFVSDTSLADVKVSDVKSTDTGLSMPFSAETVLLSDEYVVS